MDAGKFDEVGVARSGGAGSVESEVDGGSLGAEDFDVADVDLEWCCHLVCDEG